MDKLENPLNVYDACDQGLINMHVDLCLIRLVRDYGGRLQDFDPNSRETAIDRSLDFMDRYVEEFELHLQYLKTLGDQRQEKPNVLDSSLSLGNRRMA